MKWHAGLGRDLGFLLWSRACFEGTFGAFSTAWPLWIESRGASLATVGLVLALQGIIRPFFMIAGSSISERVNLKAYMILNRLLLVAGMYWAASVHRWELLLITVLGYAFGELVYPPLHAQISLLATENETQAYTLICTIFPSIAMIISPLVAGLAVREFGLGAAIMLAATLSLIGTLLLIPIRFASPTPAEAEEASGNYRSILHDVPTRTLLGGHFISMMLIGIGVTLLPNFLRNFRGLRPDLITVLSTGAAVGSTLFGLISLRIDAIRRGPTLGAAIGAGFASLAFLVFSISGAVPMVALGYLFRGGLIAVWTFYLTAVGQHAPRRLQTRAFALVEILGGGAWSFSPLIAAWLYDIHPTLPMNVACVGGLMATLIAIAIWRRRFPDVGRKPSPRTT